MPATMPYTPTVITSAMPTSTVACLANGSPATVPSAMTMISADRMKSVRIAPLIFSFSSATVDVRIASAAGQFAGAWLPRPHVQDLWAIFSKPSKHRYRRRQSSAAA
jgi:hypothetical protein